MNIDYFKEMMYWAEPDFEYNGEQYSICHPDGKYYVLSSDCPKDEELVFQSVDEMLDGWIIQGRTLREILPDIEM